MTKTHMLSLIAFFGCSLAHAGSTITDQFSADGQTLTITILDNGPKQSAIALYNRFLAPADAAGVKAVDIGFFRIECAMVSAPEAAAPLAKCAFTLVYSPAVSLNQRDGTGDIRLYGDEKSAQVRTAFTTSPDFLYMTPDDRLTMGIHESNFTFVYTANP